MILIDLFSKPHVVCTCQLLVGNGFVLMQAKFCFKSFAEEQGFIFEDPKPTTSTC